MTDPTVQQYWSLVVAECAALSMRAVIDDRISLPDPVYLVGLGPGNVAECRFHASGRPLWSLRTCAWADLPRFAALVELTQRLPQRVSLDARHARMAEPRLPHDPTSPWGG